MLTNFYLLKEFAKFLNKKIANSFFISAFSQEKNKAVLEFESESERSFIEFSSESRFPYIVIKNEFARTARNSAMILKDAAENEVKYCEEDIIDRAIKVIMKSGDELVFALVPARLNVFHLNAGIVTDSFKNFAAVKGKKLHEIIKVSNKHFEIKTNSDYLLAKNRMLGKIYSSEILFRAGLDPKSELSNKDILDKITEEVEYELNNSEYFLYTSDLEAIPSLMNLHSKRNMNKEIFNDANSLISGYMKYYLKHIYFENRKRNLIAKLDSERQRYKKILSNIELTAAENESAEILLKKGNLLLANITMDCGSDIAKLNDDNGDLIEIELKPNLSVLQNANLYFEKYKRKKESVKLLKAKSERIRSSLNKAEMKIKRAEFSNTHKEISLMEKEYQNENQEVERKHFRKFILDEQFQVWVGKDSYSNDLLTTKYTSQNDLWFHVRGASGSHTVLKRSSKSGEIPKDIIKIAASIAAYYSKSRNAGNVPVAYCEKKYVKKLKGLKQGAVIMEREKVVNVKPGLPEEVN